MTTERTTQQGVPEVNIPEGLSDEAEIAGLFKKKWQDARKEPSRASTDEEEVAPVSETDEEADLSRDEEDQDREEPEDHVEDDATEEQPVEEKPSKKVVSDDDEVVVKVGDQELRASVKDLKRLYGQEAALTRKSQEVAQKNQILDTAYQKLIERAEARLKQFDDIDFDLLARNPRITDAELSALKKERAEAEADVRFLRAEAGQAAQRAAEERQRMLSAAAVETRKVLTDPNSQFHIPNWNGEVYQKLHQFATTELGMPDERFFTIVAPAELKVLWMAQQFAEASKKVPVRLKPTVKATPKKVMAPSSGSAEGKDEVISQARRQVAENDGDIDSVANLFKAKWRAARR